MSVLGEGFIRLRPLATGFEAEAKASVERALGNLSKGGGAAANLEKDFAKAGGSVRSAAGEMGQAGKQAETLAGKLGVTSKAGKAAFGTLEKEVTGKLGALSSAGGEVSGIMSKLSGSLGSIGPAGAAVGAVLALDAAALGLIGSSIHAFQELASDVRAFQRVAGGTAETDSLLVASLHDLGVSPQIAARGFFQLSKTIEQHQEKLSELGIDVARSANGEVDLQGTLFNVSDAFNATTDQAKKNQIAFTAFGRAGLALIPVLARGKQGLAELNKEAEKAGLKLSPADLEEARQLTISSRQLSDAVLGLKVRIGRDFTPTATTTVHAGTRLVEGLHKVGRAFGDLADYAVGATLGISYFKKGTDDSKKSIDEQAAAAELDAEAVAGLQKQIDAVSAASIAQISATNAVTSAQNQLDDANKAVADSGKELARLHDQSVAAQHETTKAQDDYNKILKVGGADVDALAAATRRLRDLTVSLEEAQNGVADSQADITTKTDALNDAIDTYGRNSSEAKKAATELRDAQVGLDSAQNRVLDTQDQIKDAHKDQADATAGSAASRQRLADAQDKLTKAQDAEKQAQDAETTYRDNIPRLVEAQKQAYENLATARANLTEQQQLAAGADKDSIDKGQLLRDQYDKLEATLDPNSPLYKALEAQKNLILDTAAATDALVNSTKQWVGLGGGDFGPASPKAPQVPHAAAGASFGAGEWGWVGEAGPELVRFRQGGQVFPHAESVAMAGAGSTNVFNIYPAQGQSEVQIARHVDAIAGGAVGRG